MGFRAPPDLTPLCASEDLLEVMLVEFAEEFVPCKALSLIPAALLCYS
jgi:hypothetical protein